MALFPTREGFQPDATLPTDYPACNLDSTEAFAGHRFASQPQAFWGLRPAFATMLLLDFCLRPILQFVAAASHDRRHGRWAVLISSSWRVEYDPFSEARRELPTHFPTDWLATFRLSVDRHPLLDAQPVSSGLGFCRCGCAFAFHRFIPELPVSRSTD